ncbi:alkaline phosphatase [Bacillaceae bacterium SIJ1]|uniref:alkaline phosphatase n=1 Tax=Litoribacterium kuwaitense TaxID=1398745 RepID=UPI0013EE29D5|nr:alkaline phosphatase [Litoribacterium kuwaitense]NGP45751.1 alkaline phosphatase [Litoribacterium kuwaitense]
MFSKPLVKKIAPLAAATTLAVTSLIGTAQQAEASDQQTEDIKNVIFLVGDGMGPSFTTMYRYYKDNPDTPVMEMTEFDPYLVGLQSTYPGDLEQNITDSAAAATTMSSGVKTYNGAIAVDMEKQNVETVLEMAKMEGKSTGLVATSQVNHATPAAFGAHNESRQNYNEIADDYFDLMIDGNHVVDVILGGGTDYFDREDRNLINEFEKDGYSYVTNREQMMNDDNEQVLGLFAPVGMDKMIDRNENTPSLNEMTESALDRLNKNDDGFFLMVEGSQIDWAGHDNDVVGVMSEMEDFEEAFATAIDFAKEDGETLVVATADHSTGGMSIGRAGSYEWDPAALKKAKRSPDFMAKQIADGAGVEGTLRKYIDFELTADEIQAVKDSAVNGNATLIDNAIERIFDVRSGTGWTTGGHTAVDVPVYAFGPGLDMFTGQIDNADTGFGLIEAITGERPE